MNQSTNNIVSSVGRYSKFTNDNHSEINHDYIGYHQLFLTYV